MVVDNENHQVTYPVEIERVEFVFGQIGNAANVKLVDDQVTVEPRAFQAFQINVAQVKVG